MTIGEISAATNLSLSTLRYYEKKGLIRVARDKNNRRVYDKSDVAWLEFINRLKETGMLLRDIQNYSELRYLGKETVAERLEILREHRKTILNELDKWKNYLQNLDDKIKFYEENLDGKVTKIDGASGHLFATRGRKNNFGGARDG